MSTALDRLLNDLLSSDEDEDEDVLQADAVPHKQRQQLPEAQTPLPPAAGSKAPPAATAAATGSLHGRFSADSPAHASASAHSSTAHSALDQPSAEPACTPAPKAALPAAEEPQMEAAVEPAAAAQQAAAFELLGDLGSGDLQSLVTGRLPAQPAALLAAAPAAVPGDLLSGLEGWAVDAPVAAALLKPPYQAAALEAAQLAVPAEAGEARPTVVPAQPGWEEGELSGGLSDLEDSSEEEAEVGWAELATSGACPLAPTAAAAAAAADQQHADAAAVASTAAGGEAGVEVADELQSQPSLGGLSDVSTETDAGSDDLTLPVAVADQDWLGDKHSSLQAELNRPGELLGPAVPAGAAVTAAQRDVQQGPSNTAASGTQQQEQQQEQQAQQQQAQRQQAGVAAEPARWEDRPQDVRQPASPQAQQQAQDADHLDRQQQQQQAQHPAQQQEHPPPPQQQQQQPQAQQQQQQQQSESLLQAAERLEARLAAGTCTSGGSPKAAAAAAAAGEEDAAYRADLLLASIVSQLEPEAAATGTAPASSGSEGAVLGRLAAARSFLLPNFEQLFRGPQAAGQPCAVAKYLGIAAVGTGSGATFVLLPGTPGAAGGKQAQAPQPPRLLEVGGDRQHTAQGAHVRDAVTALCMGQHSGSVLLLVGHASGAVRVWELKSQLGGGVHFALTKSLGGMHASAVTAAALLDGGGGSGTTWALTADAHGRLMCHNFSRHLSATSALSSFARGLTGSSGGAGPSHLIPLQQAAAGGGAAFDPGTVCALLPLHSGVGGGGAGLATSGQAQFAADSASGFSVPEAGHFLLLVCTKAVLACLLTPEGRLQVLHVFLPPHHLPAGCTPYAAWRLASTGKGGSGGIIRVHLAVAWHYSLSVYSAVLLQRRPAGPPQQQRQAAAQPLAPPSLLRSWTVPGSLSRASTGSSSGDGSNPGSPSGSSDGGVCCCHFLDSGPLVVLSSQGETSTAVHLYRPDFLTAAPPRGGNSSTSASGGADGGEAVESLVVRDWVVGSQAVALIGGGGGSTFHQSAGGFGDQLLMLNSQGVRVAQLLSWQQRVSALASQQQQQRPLVAALLAAVRIYQAAVATAATGGPAAPRQQTGAAAASWPADGHLAAVADVQRQLLTILCAYVDERLSSLAAASGAAAGTAGGSSAGAAGGEAGARSAAEAAAAEAAAAQLADTAIGCCLLVRRPDSLWSDLFPRFQRHTTGKAAFLQQLLPAILSDQLPSVAPEVMQALVEHCVAAGQPEAVERCVLKMDLLSLDLNQLIPLCIRHRLYAALLHIFTGALQDHQTPAALLLVASAAAGEAEAAAGAAAASVAAAATPGELLAAHDSLRLGYKLLVFLRCCLLGLRYPPGSGCGTREQQERSKAQALAFLLYSTGLSVWECWRLWGEVAHSQAAAAVQQLPLSIEDPHPALRYLCRLDAPAVLGLLRQGLDGWDALETDLAEVSPEIRSQVVVQGASRTVAQAVVDAVVGLLQSGAFAADDSLPASPAGPAAETAALHFLAAHLASNRAVVSGGVLLRVLQHLAAPAPALIGASGPGSAAADMSPAHGAATADMSPAQREAVFCDVVAAAGAGMSLPDQQQAIFLAQRAGFLQAEARVRHAEGRLAEALACLARDPRHPAAPFKYVRDVLSNASVSQQQRDAFAATVLQQAPQLLTLDALATSQLVLECFPGQQSELLSQLEAHPAQQFAFLKNLVALHQEQQQAAGGGGGGGGSLKAAGASPQLSGLLCDMRVANLYLRLLCQYEPRSVLPYLQAHDAYGVDECLQYCLEHRIQDGAAFLLERRGDVHSALKIYIQTLDRANRALVEAVRAGQLDLAGAAAAALAAAEADNGGGLAARARHGGAAVALMRTRPGLLQRGGATSGSDAAAAAAALLGSGLPPPRELQVARDALGSAVAMCLRYSDDRVALEAASASGGLSYPAAELGDAAAGLGSRARVAADPLQQLWFQVLQCYVALLRELRQEEQRMGGAGEEAAAGTGAQMPPASPDEQQWQLELLQELITGFMDEVIGSMAGQVPLRSIADVIMQQYGADRWGDFKGTLLGLLTACGAELSILKCAHRVVAADGTHILASSYRRCTRPSMLPPAGCTAGGLLAPQGQTTAAATDGSVVRVMGAAAAAGQVWVQRGSDMLARAAGKAAV